MTIDKLTAAIGGLVLAPLVLAGCASEALFEEAIPPAVLASDANIVDTQMQFSSGPGGRGIMLRVYVTDTSAEAVAGSIGAALGAAYHAAPSRPTGIILDVGAAPKPDDVDLNFGRLALDEVVPLLELPGTVINDRVTLSSDELDSAFGSWGEQG